MAEAVYVRFDEKTLDEIKKLEEDSNITRSEAIKKLVSYALKRLTKEKAITCYKEGKCTMREGAEIAGVRYFEFFDILAKENLIGTGSEDIELIINNLGE